MRKKTICFLLFCLILAESVGQKKISVLFIGNSLTYANNLPELLEKIGDCEGVKVQHHTIALPNYALVDHWNDGLAQKEIKTGRYDFVVVQQGPSSQAEGRMLLLDYGLKFSSLCDQHHAKLVSYMVWPAKPRSFDFQGVHESYKLMADSAKAIFCPAGKAWLTVWKDNPDFTLYSGDNFHPHYNGSLLAALVMYGSLTRKEDLGFVQLDKLKSENLSQANLTILIKAAEKTLAENKSTN